MQLPKVINSDELILKINETNLYEVLIVQLNKDFIQAGIDVDFTDNSSPKELFEYLNEVISVLLRKRFDDFLNLLYRIDINENQIKSIITAMSGDTEQEITFLILKREWQKVWFRRFY